MDQLSCDKRLSQVRRLPLISFHDKERLLECGKRLIARGIYSMELPFRGGKEEEIKTLESISYLKSNFPMMLVGAGTVTSISLAKSAIAAGAEFALSPGSDDEVTKFCIDAGLAIYPGVMTANEVQKNVKLGLRLLKFFPAVIGGSSAYALSIMKALTGPFPDVRFLVSGGVDYKNEEEFLKEKFVSLVCGSYLSKE